MCLITNIVIDISIMEYKFRNLITRIDRVYWKISHNGKIVYNKHSDRYYKLCKRMHSYGYCTDKLYRFMDER